MKTDLFYWLLNAGIFGTCIGLGLLLVRRIKKMPRRLIYGLWALPLLRFWMPFGFSNPFSLLTLISKVATKTVTIHNQRTSLELSVTNFIQAADTYFPITYKANLFNRVFSIASVVWLIGFCSLILTAALLYMFTLSEMRTAKPLGDNVYLSDLVTTPCLYGIIKPKIVLPGYMETKDMDYILLHEKTHAKRKDNLFRVIALFTAALHWYNPLIWVLLKKYLEDLELACDESVISRLSEPSRKAYALSLVKATELRSVFVSSFGGAKIRVRIEKILSFRSLSLASLAALIIFLVVMAVTLLTNATI